MHFHDWWMKFWGTLSFLEISTPSRDVMIVNYSSVNEKMVDKMNVKIVSAMLNEVRSILADTIEPDSFQINQFHNKDLSQHQLNWPGECFALYMNVSLLICFEKFVFLMGVFIFAETSGLFVKHSSGISLLKFLPQHKHWGEILFQQKCKFLSKHSNKTWNIFFGKIRNGNCFI